MLIFSPTGDSYIRTDKPTRNFGTATAIKVDNSPMMDFLLKFSVSGVGARQVTSVKLRLYAVNPSGVGGQFHRVTDTTWSERTVTWNNAPPADSTVLATLGAVASGNWYEVDVTPLVTTDGTVSLRAASPSTNGADYSSKEGTAGFAPQLVVTVSASP